MNDEAKVWVSARKCRGKTTYHLRWIDASTCRWRSRACGTDHKRAEREAALLQDKLELGTYRHTNRITWRDFVADHVAKIVGKSDATEASRTLNEFGAFARPTGPNRVTYTMIEAFAAHLRTKGDRAKAAAVTDEARKAAVRVKNNSTATINKKLRYLRVAFNLAVERGYVGQNPMRAGLFTREDSPEVRVVTNDEEAALLKSAKDLYGPRLQAFIVVALGTGGRRGELTALTWDRVDFDDKSILFTHTKGKRDRRIPVGADVVASLRRIRVLTESDGGPFVSLRSSLGRTWGRVRADAGLSDVSIHDLRRTYITRAFQAGVPVPTVQRLAGHADIKTTLKYYNRISMDDLRSAVAKMSVSA